MPRNCEPLVSASPSTTTRPAVVDATMSAMRRTLSTAASPRLLVIDAYPAGFGGAHRVTAELVDVVTGHGWRAGVVMPAPGEAVAALRSRGVDVEVVAAPRPLLHYGASTRGVR